MKTYRFYGWESADVPPADPRYSCLADLRDLYDVLAGLWCRETCAPRLQDRWTRDNPTLGQCSITAFLVQDIFGGKVYGILRPGGNYHCYNAIGGRTFDLTSEQFQGEKLCYSDNPEQFREVHFAKKEKYERYRMLKAKVEEAVWGVSGNWPRKPGPETRAGAGRMQKGKPGPEE